MEETRKTYHQEGRVKQSKTAFIGSILLLISALLPCLDVLSKIIYPPIIDMRDSTGVLITVDIWLATLYISPSIIFLAISFKPNPRLYFLPLFMFFYTGIVYFSPVIGYKVDFFKFNSWVTVILSVIVVILYMYLLRYIRRITLAEDANEDFLIDVENEIEKLTKENQYLKAQIKSPEQK